MESILSDIFIRLNLELTCSIDLNPFLLLPISISAHGLRAITTYVVRRLQTLDEYDPRSVSNMRVGSRITQLDSGAILGRIFVKS